RSRQSTRPPLSESVPATASPSTLSLHDALPIWFTVVQAVPSLVLVAGGKYRHTPAVYDPEYAQLEIAIGDDPEHIILSVAIGRRSEEHTSELQSREKLVCRLLLEKKKSQEFSRK